MHATTIVPTPGFCLARGTGWQPLPSYFVVFTLALLLVSTTPMGTGAGVHQFDLVHPLFAHVHIVNGQVLTHEQMAQDQTTPRSSASRSAAGPAFGAGSAAAQADSGVGASPTVPFQAASLLPVVVGPRLLVEPRLPPGQGSDAPPDPPPTSAA